MEAPMSYPSLYNKYTETILYFFLYMLLYGTVCMRMGLHQDEILDWEGAQQGFYISLGRWGIAAWRAFFSKGTCYWTAGVVAGMMISATICLLTSMLQLAESWKKAVFAAFYLGCISFSFMLHYSYQCDVLAAAFLCCALSNNLLSKGGILRYVLAVCLLTFAFGTYQATVFYFISIWLALQLRKYQLGNHGNILYSLLQLIILSIISYIACYIIYEIALLFPCVSPEDIHTANTYLSSLSGVRDFLEADAKGKWDMVLFCFQLYFWNLLGRLYSGQWVYVSAFIPVTYLLLYWSKNLPIRKAFLPILMTGALWIMPYSLGVLLLHQQDPRTFIAEPVSLACLWGLFVSACPQPKLRIALFIFLPFMLLKSAYQISKDAYEEAREYEAGLISIRQVCQDGIEKARQCPLGKNTPIILGGGAKDGREGHCHNLPYGAFMPHYLKFMQMPDNIRQATPSDYEKHIAQFKRMPLWPDEGSIQESNGVILIRMGQLPAPYNEEENRKAL